MSVLKNKRTTSKAEFVNTANEIYTETINFLSRLSARYSRLLADPTAKLAAEVVDNGRAAVPLLPGYDEEPAGVLYRRQGKQGPQKGGGGTPGGHEPNPGGTDRRGGRSAERDHEKRRGPAEEKKKVNRLFGCISENVPCGRAAPDGTAANHWCRSVNSSNTNNFCLVNTNGNANNNNANNSWGEAPGFYTMGQMQ